MLPAVSVGNVGQLAVDVLLASLDPPPRLISQVVHPSLIPVVGGDPLKENSTAVITALQLYLQADQQLAIMQIRSGILPGKGQQFIQDLICWSKEKKLKEIILVGSSHAHERTDSQLSGTPLRYLTTWERAVPADFLLLEKRERFPGLSTGEEGDTVFIPGGGIARRLYECCLEEGVALTLLIKFAAEGDNSVDGLVLAGALNALISFLADRGRQQLRAPPSWQHVFGPPPPRDLFW